MSQNAPRRAAERDRMEEEFLAQYPDLGAVAVYRYRAAPHAGAHEVYLFVVRIEMDDDKEFRQCSGTLGQWKFGAGNGAGTRWQPYGVEELEASPDVDVWFVEGEKARHAWSDAGHLCVTNSGGANGLKRCDLAPLKDRDVIVWPDYDGPGTKWAEELTPLLFAAGASSVQRVEPNELAKMPTKGDAADWVALGHAEVPTSAIAPVLKPPPTGGRSADGPNDWTPTFVGPFEASSRGLVHCPGGERPDERIGDWLRVRYVGTCHGRRQRIVQFFRRADGAAHHVSLPEDSKHGRSVDALKVLTNAGYFAKKGCDELLKEYIFADAPHVKEARLVDRPGWCDRFYVDGMTRDTGRSDKDGLPLVYVGECPSGRRSAREVSGWQEGVARRIEQYPLLVFGIATALCGPLMTPLGWLTMGFLFRGPSSTGKTTACRIAMSLWSDDGTAAIHTWHATPNGLEQLAVAANDGFLVLDEMEQSDGEKLGGNIYILNNGRGKARDNRYASLELPREAAHWRLTYLSTGERRVRELLAEVNQKWKLGQEVRLVELRVPDGEGVLWTPAPRDAGDDDAQDCPPQRAAAERRNLLAELEVAAWRNGGTVCVAWLEYLNRLRADDAAWTRAIEDASERLDIATWVEPNSNADRRVMEAFRRVAVAGELAIMASILPWPPGHVARCAAILWGQYSEEKQSEESILQLRALKVFDRHPSISQRPADVEGEGGPAWWLSREDLCSVVGRGRFDMLLDALDHSGRLVKTPGGGIVHRRRLTPNENPRRVYCVRRHPR